MCESIATCYLACRVAPLDWCADSDGGSRAVAADTDLADANSLVSMGRRPKDANRPAVQADG